MILLQFIFWLSVFCVVHSYLLYPLILWFGQKDKKQNQMVYERNDPDLPEVAVIMAVHNEEKVIARKIESVFTSLYPLNKISFYIGSDNSIDQTNSIVRKYQEQYSNIHFALFERSGKAQVINILETQTTQPVLILTDANVFFEPDTIYHLVKHYKNPEISLVGSNIINDNLKRTGISYQEKFYLDSEKVIKYHQGVIWGAMIGAFGGCYSIRKKEYTPVPRNFFMDDFYITMGALKKGGKAINELEAVCFEDVSNKISEEFRRKIRISIGNFQNLGAYKSLLWPPLSGIAFSFLSYKVLRWLTPFFILLSFGMNLLLKDIHSFYTVTFYLQLFLLIIPLLDWILRINNINLKLFRFITHFYAMNLALLIGFFKFLKGVNSSIWKPTERNQT